MLHHYILTHMELDLIGHTLIDTSKRMEITEGLWRKALCLSVCLSLCTSPRFASSGAMASLIFSVLPVGALVKTVLFMDWHCIYLKGCWINVSKSGTEPIAINIYSLCVFKMPCSYWVFWAPQFKCNLPE